MTINDFNIKTQLIKDFVSLKSRLGIVKTLDKKVSFIKSIVYVSGTHLQRFSLFQEKFFELFSVEKCFYISAMPFAGCRLKKQKRL